MDDGTLGKYQLQAILGEGGMGVVYRAYDPHLDRVVAIKTVRRSLLEGKSGSDLRDRFRREARAEGRLLHPNIITIYEYQEDAQGTPFFVMEYVAGKDLKKYLSNGMKFNLDKALDIVEQVLHALSYSHRKGIVHRDIKPANIILLEEGGVKIADFGIAKMEESEFTQTGLVLGTPQYISPEQRMGRLVDARTDLYSTGAVLYELITGEKALAIIGAKKGRRSIKSHAALKSADPKIDRILKQVVAKALADDADDRFTSADDFLQALKIARPTPKRRNWHVLSGVMMGLLLGLVLLAAGYHFLYPQLSTEKSRPGASKVAVAAPRQLSEAEKSSLQKHLKVARVHLLVGRLILPVGSNALESFNLALKIDPDNKEAREGLANIRSVITGQISASIDAGNLEEAETQLATALEAFPQDPDLLALKQQL